MDVPVLIRERLMQLGLEQRDLARAAQVTESYISQLLTRKKAPPAPGRTDIYHRMDRFLELPRGELAKLAAFQRKEELKKTLGDESTPLPLFPEVRASILRTCRPDKADQVRAMIEREPFGELERLVTQKLLDVTKRVVKEELKDEQGIRRVAKLAGLSYEATRVRALEFLDTDIFHLTTAACETFLDPLIESWDIDLATFGLQVVLNRRVTAQPVKRFDFVERGSDERREEEPGFTEFMEDRALSETATDDEVSWLKRVYVPGRRPTPLFYYRALQVLRDPLHFTSGPAGHALQPRR